MMSHVRSAVLYRALASRPHLVVPRSTLGTNPSTLSVHPALSGSLNHARTSVVKSAVADAELGPSSDTKGPDHEERMQELVEFLRGELPRIFRTGVCFSLHSAHAVA